MPIQYINTGTAPNQGNGDTLRTAFTKINNNFAELANNTANADLIGAVISHPELQRGISVTYDAQGQAASFLVNIAAADTLGGVRIGAGITVDPNTGLINVFDGNYNNLTNIPQALGTTASPTFADLHVTGNLDIAGQTTVVNATVIETADLTITLAKNATNDTEANTAGIIVNGPSTPASLRYASSDDSWNFNKKVNVSSLYINGTQITPTNLGDITFDANTIGTANQNEDIILNPNGAGRVRLASTPIQFDNGNNGIYNGHLLYSAPSSGKVGLGIGESNNSLRIVGDGVTPGVVADFGTYANGTGTWTSNVTVNSDGSLKASGVIYQGTAYNNVDYSNTTIRVDTDVDSYAEMVMQNNNAGINASTDLVIMNDQGTEFANIIDLGINSSNYSVEQYSVTEPGDGYLFTNGGNLVIGTQSPGKRIKFHAGGTTVNDSVAQFDEYAWTFNRPVTIDVNRPIPLNFTVVNRSSNVVAQSLFEAVNDTGNAVHLGVNSSHPEAFYGRVGPSEAFLHIENSTSTLHIGGYGDLSFYSNQVDGYAGTPTLVMSSIDQSSRFDGHLLPTTDLAYDLGSLDKQWRSLYVGTATIYIGGVPVSINTASNTLVIGTSTNTTATGSTNLATEDYVINYVTQNNTGLTGWTVDPNNSIVPNTDILQDIGTPSNRVRHIYVGPGSITVGNSVITESATGKLVLPGVTRATGYHAGEIQDTGDQTHAFTSVPVIIDHTYYSILDGQYTPNGSYIEAEYSVNQLDGDGFIDGIGIVSPGSGWNQTEADGARNNNMWAYTGTDGNPFAAFVPTDWIQVPFVVYPQASDTEYEFSTGGTADTGYFGFSGNVLYNKDDTNQGLYIAPGGESTSIIYVPGNGDSDTTPLQITNTSGNGKIRIQANSKLWTFDQNGDITFPDDTVQTTAYTGGANGNPFDQTLNTTDNVTFNQVTIGSDGGESHLVVDAQNYWTSIQWKNLTFAQDPNTGPFECQAQLIRVFKGSNAINGHEERVAVSVVQPTGTEQNGIMITTSDGKIPDAPYNDGVGTQHNFVFGGDGSLQFPDGTKQATAYTGSTGGVQGLEIDGGNAFTQATELNIDGGGA